jgi:hypothetical protein
MKSLCVLLSLAALAVAQPPPDQARIVASILAGIAPAAVSPPTVLFLAGGVGTDKGVTIAGMQARGLWPAAPAYISVDGILRNLSTFTLSDPCTAGSNAAAAATIAAAAYSQALIQGYNIIFDGTLSTSSFVTARIGAANALGYRVLLGATSVPTAYAAQTLSTAAAAAGGGLYPIDIIVGTSVGLSTSFFTCAFVVLLLRTCLCLWRVVRCSLCVPGPERFCPTTRFFSRMDVCARARASRTCVHA